MAVSSCEIKIALLSYFRFKKQHVCADEVGFALGNTDVSVFDEGFVTEIEIKTSKSDLWQGEKRKASKHAIYKNPTPDDLKKYVIPNQFFVCVPTELLNTAKEWVLTTYEKYGILEWKGSKAAGIWTPRPEDMIYVHKRAKNLHDEKHPKALERIARRLSSVNISLKSHVQTLIRSNNDAYKEIRKLKELENGRGKDVPTK